MARPAGGSRLRSTGTAGCPHTAGRVWGCPRWVRVRLEVNSGGDRGGPMTREQGGGYLARPEPSGLADVVEVVLDKGIVIDAYARVSLVGIEVLTIDARVVISSVDTYLRFAEATNRLDLYDQDGDSALAHPHAAVLAVRL